PALHLSLGHLTDQKAFGGGKFGNRRNKSESDKYNRIKDSGELSLRDMDAAALFLSL
ncbi:unnamed protein product, partial [Allacma fusca]